jgi:hypothetical protein
MSVIVDVPAHVAAAIYDQDLSARIGQRASDHGSCQARADYQIVDSHDDDIDGNDMAFLDHIDLLL